MTKTIYIADDDEDDRMLLREAILNVIDDAGIIEVCDGIELVDRIKLEGHAGETVILMDMNMPRMNGLEALAVIKSDIDLIHIPIIMISTASNPELINQSLSERNQCLYYETISDKRLRGACQGGQYLFFS